MYQVQWSAQNQTLSTLYLVLQGEFQDKHILIRNQTRWTMSIHLQVSKQQRMIIKLIPMYVYSRSINSTRNSTLKNIKNSEKSEGSWLTQLWVVIKYDY